MFDTRHAYVVWTGSGYLGIRRHGPGSCTNHPRNQEFKKARLFNRRQDAQQACTYDGDCVSTVTVELKLD